MTAAEDRSLTVGIGVGVALVVLGVGAYVATDFASVTALIPAIFGILCVALGRLGRGTDRGRLARYGLGALAVLGIAGSARGIGDMVTLATGGTVESAAAVASQAAMVALCLVLLGAVALSFVD